MRRFEQRTADNLNPGRSVAELTDDKAKGFEPEVGMVPDSLDSTAVVHEKNFLPLLPDVPQHRQVKLGSTDAPHASTAPRVFGEKRLDLQTSGHAKKRAFIPLLPDVGTDCSRQGVLEFVPNAASVSQKSPSAGVLDTERPSHNHQENVAEAAVQGKSIRQARSKAVRRYEWPLIINGVYQGEGPLPSCRIEDNESPTEPRPYDWPLIVLHRARSVGECDQRLCPDGKAAAENTAEGEEKVEGIRTDEKSIDG